MRPSILNFCFAVAAFSAAAMGQEPNSSATSWREGKPMYPAEQQVREVSDQQHPQNGSQQYAAYNIALFLPNSNGGDVVLPFMSQGNQLVFYPLSRALEAGDKIGGLGRPISYGELLSLIGSLQIELDRLKQENDKLWAVVTKSSGQQTVVVQPPPAPPQVQAPTETELRQGAEQQKRQLILMYLLGQQPQRVNMNVNVRDCTRYPALCVQ